VAKKVVIVDKDKVFVESARQAFEDKGFSVEAVSGVVKCIESVKNKRPDVILFDVQVEENDGGLIACRKVAIHEKIKDIPVIMISGIRKDKNLPFGFEADSEFLPVRAVVEKPVKPEELVVLIDKILGK